MTQIPFLDLREAYLELKPEIDRAVARVLDSGWYILGPEVEAFEAEFAAYCEAQTPSASPTDSTPCISPCARSAWPRATR